MLQSESSLCQPSEDRIECRIRWMSSFSERGFWDFSVRKFFFDQVVELWGASKKEEVLVKFVLKDQELELGRPNLLREAGIEEDLANQYILIHQEDELNNLKLTESIFNFASSQMEDVSNAPSPHLLKFKEMRAEVQPRLMKIPEVEKDIERLRLSSHR